MSQSRASGWRSTVGLAPRATLRQALFAGLAPDGGLYMPERIPALPSAVWNELAGAPVAEVAATVLAPLVGDEIPYADLVALAERAFDFPLPLVPLQACAAPGSLTAAPSVANTHVLELFHGPTLAFKDVGARFMAQLMAYFRDTDPLDQLESQSADRRLTVLVATSGDTGSAVAQAFHRMPDIDVVILFPKGQVSVLQERQLTTLGDNVRAFAVAGSFDDCQRLVKEAFLDPRLRVARQLTSANSINVGRLLPQMVYYVVGALALQALSSTPTPPAPLVVVPSGNFGNLAAGLLARHLGAPLGRFLAATNANDVVPEFLAGGAFAPRPSVSTSSNAMDVGSPSNWARIADLYAAGRALSDDQLRAALARDLDALTVDDAATRAAIREAYERFGYVFDPHTAVGWVALERWRTGCGGRAAEAAAPAMLLATAHPAKFRETVEPAIGRPLDLPEPLAACLTRPQMVADLAPHLDDLRRVLI